MIKQLKNKMMLFLGAILLMTGLRAQSPIQVINTSSSVTCDGIAYFSDSTQILTDSVSWQGMGSVIQQGGCSIFNLCPGTYVVTYVTLNTTFTQTLTFTIGSNSVDCSGFSISVNTTPTDSINTCNGTAWVEVTGGTAPYTYQWTTSQTGNQIGNLCTGEYGCFVLDANGCTDTTSFTVESTDTTSVGDSLIDIYNNSFPDSLITGFIGNNVYIVDCSVMNFSTVDSAYITGVDWSYGDTTLNLSWSIFGDSILEMSTSYIVSDTLSSGVYNVTLTLVCGQKSSNVTYVQITDQVKLEYNSINELNSNTFVCKNPFTNLIEINFKEIGNYSVEITDVLGKKVYSGKSKTNLQIDATSFTSGTYFVKVSDANGIAIRKIIK